MTVSDPAQFHASDTVILSVNLPPVIDSLRINASTYSPVPASITFDGTRNDSIVIVTFARDPENTAITVSWAAMVPMLFTKVNDTTMRYQSLNQAYKDTLTGTVTDVDGFVKVQKIYLNISNNRPSIDSIATPSDTLRLVSPNWQINTTVLTQISMSLFTHDLDDNLASRTWALNTGALGTLNEIDPPLLTQVQYVCVDSLYKDTIIVAVSDTKGSVARRTLIVNVNNRPPVIDTLKIDQTSYFVRTLSEYTHTTAAPDTLALSVVAHDPNGDSYSMAWQIGTMTATGASYQYKGLDQAYSDTVTVRVMDANLTMDSLNVILRFTK